MKRLNTQRLGITLYSEFIVKIELSVLIIKEEHGH